MAAQGDEQPLYSLFCCAHAENGFGEIDHAVVQAKIDRNTDRLAKAGSKLPNIIHGADSLDMT